MNRSKTANKTIITLLATIMITTQISIAQEISDYQLSPMSFEKVTLQDEFWYPRLKTVKDVTVPFALGKTDRAIENLRKCGTFLKGNKDDLPFTHRFVSSDLYKVMEGAAYTLMVVPDIELEKQMDEIIDIIASAQKDDGYLYVSHTCGVANPREMGETPYSWVVHSHELYNMGHMYEAAIAYYRATGKDKWLKVAEKSAKHFNKVFFEGDPNYNDGKPIMQAPGHQEIELALVKLYHTTGNKLYLDMAKKFLDIRGVTYRPEGKGTMSPEYAQQHLPVREQTTAEGHAVRAAYLYAGMADVAAITGDKGLTDALDKIWHNIVDKKMHITGGLGAVHGIEGFGPAYELPNKYTYDETCSAVANVFFNFRMFLLYKDAKFFDVAEVSLLNNSLAGINIEGNEFFYVNPLEADGIYMFNHGRNGRSPWFDCACCPSNLARLLPQISGYMYSHSDDEIYMTLYGSSETTLPLADGNVTLKQTSNYPFSGKVDVVVEPEAKQKFALKLRVPTWAREKFVPGELYSYIDGLKPKWSVKVNGRKVKAKLDKGFAVIEREWKKGDKVTLDLPMPVRYNRCIDQVKANNDRIAITRGPLAYCAEEVDNGEGMVQRFYIEKAKKLSNKNIETIKEAPLNGVARLTVPAMEITESGSKKANVKLVPYYSWSNRGNGSMTVWLADNKKTAQKSMKSNLLSNTGFGRVVATYSSEDDNVEAIFDNKLPKDSTDTSIPKWSSIPQKNRHQKISVDFDEPKKLASVSVFWFKDKDAEGLTQLPRNWWIEYKVGGETKKMKKYITDFYGLKEDTFNMVRPEEALLCDGIIINILPQQHKCMGILEAQINFEN